MLIFKKDALHRKYDLTGFPVILDEFLQHALLSEKRAERARWAFMHNKISHAFEDNKNFWKEMRKLGLLPTIDGALHGFLAR